MINIKDWNGIVSVIHIEDESYMTWVEILNQKKFEKKKKKKKKKKKEREKKGEKKWGGAEKKKELDSQYLLSVSSTDSIFHLKK